MKSEKNILIAFILNLAFAVFELVGGVFTGSIAIVSDALHDAGDAAGIGVSFVLERKSKKKPDARYTYGYLRYSVIGSALTVIILIFGSVSVIYGAVMRILNPAEINGNAMIVLALVGVCVNLGAALVTRHGESLNQRAVSLHMLEDVLGWIVVLVGAVVMRFTDLYIIDPLMSIGVAVFILINAVKDLKEAFDILLEKVPDDIDACKIKEELCGLDGVIDVRNIHIWSMDGQKNYATMNIVASGNPRDIKDKIREKLYEYGIAHSTLELVAGDERSFDE